MAVLRPGGRKGDQRVSIGEAFGASRGESKLRRLSNTVDSSINPSNLDHPKPGSLTPKLGIVVTRGSGA